MSTREHRRLHPGLYKTASSDGLKAVVNVDLKRSYPATTRRLDRSCDCDSPDWAAEQEEIPTLGNINALAVTALSFSSLIKCGRLAVTGLFLSETSCKTDLTPLKLGDYAVSGRRGKKN